MDKLVTSKEFPDPGPEETLQEYAPKLIRWITKELYSRQAFAINFLLSNTNNGFHEWIKDGNVAGGDGNWKVDISTGNFVIAERVSGEWVDAFKIDATTT